MNTTDKRKVRSGLNRLLKLANHLKTGKLGHRKFDYQHISVGKPTKNHCGSSGCAIGELPIVFPKHFKLEVREEFNMNTIDSKTSTASGFRAAEEFFNLTDPECSYLFAPSNWLTQPPVLNRLSMDKKVFTRIRKMYSSGVIDVNQYPYSPSKNATKEEVAEHIIQFVEKQAKSYNIKLN